jgi:hypothetical protein
MSKDSFFSLPFILFFLLTRCAAQVQLPRSVFGCGAVSNAGPVMMNATFGQPLIGAARNATQGSFLGFWYRPENVVVSAPSSDPVGPTAMLGLAQNYPNPFGPGSPGRSMVSIIKFRTPASGSVLLSIHDLLGRRIAVPVEAWLPAGHHSVKLDAGPLPAGVVICRLRLGTASVSRTMLVLR